MGSGPNYTVIPNDWTNLEYIISDLCSRIIDEDASFSDYLLADGTRELSANWDAGSYQIQAETFRSDVTTGTAPFTVASTTKVTNLNADLLDGQTGAYYAVASTGVTAAAALTDNRIVRGDAASLAVQTSGITLDDSNNVSGMGTLSCGAITSSALTSGRIPIAGVSGLLGDDSDLTFSGDTLTATKIGAFEAAGAINFASQNMTNVDIDSGTIDGITSFTVANSIDIGNYTLTANGLTIDGTFTDGTMSLTGGNITGMGNITGSDVDISAGTGDYSSSGKGRFDSGLSIGTDATTGAGLTISTSGTRDGVSYTNTATGANEAIGLNSSITIDDASGIGYGSKTILTASGGTAYGHYVEIDDFTATKLAMGLSINATDAAVINNPTLFQHGIYVNWAIDGTDTNNRRWAFYNATGNTDMATSGKIFLGSDGIPTYWGSEYDASISWNNTNSQLDISSAVNINNALSLASGSITDSSGAISFGNENLSTTGHIGVGITADAAIGYRYSETVTATSYAFLGAPVIDANTATAVSVTGASFSAGIGAGANNQTGIVGVYSKLTYVSGVSGFTGTADYAKGLWIDFALPVAIGNRGTVTDVIGIEIDTPGASGANGEWTNVYGIKIGDMSTGTTSSWALYSAGGDSSHAGKFRLGSNVAPTHTLDVTGDSAFGDGTNETTISATGNVLLPAGAAAAGRYPIKFQAGTALTSPEAGAIEFYDSRFYVTNVAHQRALDRTSDVAVATVTCDGAAKPGGDSTDEIVLWTGVMDADSLVAGNVFKFHADGIVNSASNGDLVTLRVKVNNVTKATLQQDTKKMIDAYWHVDANATQRTIGGSGSRAIHLHLEIDELDNHTAGVVDIDTTASMDVTLTAQWNNEDAGNVISLYQGFMEYKN